MEKQMTIQTGTAFGRGLAEVVKKMNMSMACAAEALRCAAGMLRDYYSDVLGRDVSAAQIRVLLEAQAAFLGCIMPADFSLVLRAAFGVWLLSALKRCRKAMRQE